jgi:hypothetical protein
MRKLVTTTAVVLTVLGLVTTAFAGTTPETLVQGGAANQFSGDGNATYLTWSSNSGAHPRHYDALTRAFLGKVTVKMNAPGTTGYAGDINGNGTEAAYQQTDGAMSDVYLYDLDADTRTAAPDAVNSALWEWAPSVSDDYLLFGRNKFTRASSPWKIVLYDRNTDTNLVLDTAPNSCQCIFPGQVTDEWATWTRCSRSTCQAWYYDIAGDVAARVPNPLDKVQYYPGVSRENGDIYFVRSNPACGANVKIVRWNPAGGPADVVSSQPTGYDVYTGLKVFDDLGGHQDVYVDRQRCAGKYYGDIYVVNDADLAGSRVAGRPARSVGPKTLYVQGATPRG